MAQYYQPHHRSQQGSVVQPPRYNSGGRYHKTPRSPHDMTQHHDTPNLLGTASTTSSSLGHASSVPSPPLFPRRAVHTPHIQHSHTASTFYVCLKDFRIAGVLSPSAEGVVSLKGAFDGKQFDLGDFGYTSIDAVWADEITLLYEIDHVATLAQRYVDLELVYTRLATRQSFSSSVQVPLLDLATAQHGTHERTVRFEDRTHLAAGGVVSFTAVMEERAEVAIKLSVLTLHIPISEGDMFHIKYAFLGNTEAPLESAAVHPTMEHHGSTLFFRTVPTISLQTSVATLMGADLRFEVLRSVSDGWRGRGPAPPQEVATFVVPFAEMFSQHGEGGFSTEAVLSGGGTVVVKGCVEVENLPQTFQEAPLEFSRVQSGFGSTVSLRERELRESRTASRGDLRRNVSPQRGDRDRENERERERHRIERVGDPTEGRRCDVSPRRSGGGGVHLGTASSSISSPLDVSNYSMRQRREDLRRRLEELKQVVPVPVLPVPVAAAVSMPHSRGRSPHHHHHPGHHDSSQGRRSDVSPIRSRSGGGGGGATQSMRRYRDAFRYAREEDGVAAAVVGQQTSEIQLLRDENARLQQQLRHSHHSHGHHGQHSHRTPSSPPLSPDSIRGASLASSAHDKRIERMETELSLLRGIVVDQKEKEMRTRVRTSSRSRCVSPQRSERSAPVTPPRNRHTSPTRSRHTSPTRHRPVSPPASCTSSRPTSPTSNHIAPPRHLPLPEAAVRRDLPPYDSASENLYTHVVLGGAKVNIGVAGVHFIGSDIPELLSACFRGDAVYVARYVEAAEGCREAVVSKWFTPLHAACLGGGVARAPEMLTTLFRVCKVGDATRDGDTALHLLARSPVVSVECLALLLQGGANAAAYNAQGLAPLHIAALNKADTNQRFLRFLIYQGGADINQRTQDGLSALELCRADMSREVFAFFVEGGAK